MATIKTICYNCGKAGHMAKDCRLKKKDVGRVQKTD